MPKSTVYLLLNGEIPKNLTTANNYDLVCAVDGAFDVLIQQGINPDFIIGDFDSIESANSDQRFIHTPDQNFTDFDKALSVLDDKGVTEIDVFGAGGKSPDHFLGNISTALQWKHKLKLTFFDDFGSYFFMDDEIKIQGIKDKIVSLIPIPYASGIKTDGLAYPLFEESLEFGTRVGTRNKAISDEIHIKKSKGELLIFVGH